MRSGESEGERKGGLGGASAGAMEGGRRGKGRRNEVRSGESTGVRGRERQERCGRGFSKTLGHQVVAMVLERGRS